MKWLRAVRVMTGAIAALGGTAFAQAPAQAQPPGQAVTPGARTQVSCDVMVIYATNADKKEEEGPAPGPEPRTQFPQLRQPPFSAYHTMRTLSQPRLLLTIQVPYSVRLPNGRSLQVTYRGTDDHGHMRIQVAINQPGGSSYLPGIEYGATAGAAFFQAGQSYLEGVLILGFLCR